MENEDGRPDHSALPQVILDELDVLNAALKRAALADRERLIDLRKERPSPRRPIRDTDPVVTPERVPAVVATVVEAVVVEAVAVEAVPVELVVVEAVDVEASPADAEAVAATLPEVLEDLLDEDPGEDDEDLEPDPTAPWEELGVPRAEAVTLKSPNWVSSALGGADPSLVPVGWHVGLKPRRPATPMVRAQRWFRYNWPFLLASALAGVAIVVALLMIDGA